jgi:hypothetical protein
MPVAEAVSKDAPTLKPAVKRFFTQLAPGYKLSKLRIDIPSCDVKRVSGSPVYPPSAMPLERSPSAFVAKYKELLSQSSSGSSDLPPLKIVMSDTDAGNGPRIQTIAGRRKACNLILKPSSI